MTTPSNVLTDADLEMLADLAPYGPKGEWFFPMDDEEAEWCERMGGLLIAANRMTPTHEGKHYKRSPLADALLATLDHHTQQARADERRRISRMLEAACDLAADDRDEELFRITNELHESLEAATTNEGTDQ